MYSINLKNLLKMLRKAATTSKITFKPFKILNTNNAFYHISKHEGIEQSRIVEELTNKMENLYSDVKHTIAVQTQRQLSEYLIKDSLPDVIRELQTISNRCEISFSDDLSLLYYIHIKKGRGDTSAVLRVIRKHTKRSVINNEDEKKLLFKDLKLILDISTSDTIFMDKYRKAFGRCF